MPKAVSTFTCSLYRDQDIRAGLLAAMVPLRVDADIGAAVIGIIHARHVSGKRMHRLLCAEGFLPRSSESLPRRDAPRCFAIERPPRNTGALAAARSLPDMLSLPTARCSSSVSTISSTQSSYGSSIILSISENISTPNWPGISRKFVSSSICFILLMCQKWYINGLIAYRYQLLGPIRL